MKQYYIKIKGKKIPVTEEVYRAYMRPVWREQKRMKIYAEIEISYDCMVENGAEPEDTTQEDIDKIVVDKLFSELISEKLHEALDEFDDGEKFLIEQIYFKNKSERDIEAETGIAQTTINYQKNKILKKLYKKLKNL